jgi:hypothetical protein
MSTVEKGKHTPGPWFVNGPWHIQAQGQMGDIRPRIVAQAVNARPDTPEGLATLDANARLIASAPELLEMLALALPYVEEAESDPVNKKGSVAKLIKQIRAAIAKAEGKDAMTTGEIAEAK